jgi:hypothetical protein
VAGKASAIVMDIIAKDGASAILKKVGGEARLAGQEAEKSSGGWSKMKTAGVAAGVAVGAAVVKFGKDAVDKFKEVGGQTMTLQRLMGGTAEEASRLRFAAGESGVGFDTLAKSTGKLEKGLGGALGSSKATAAMIKTLGFDFRDAHGHILPMTDLLPKLSDKFKAMPNGAEKTALAMKLFGKSGADMIPFLNKGSDAIKDLEHESDKFGLTLTGKNLDALKKSKASQREWNASLEGLKVQFGAQLLPILNTFVGILRDKVIPVVTKVTGFMQQHKNVVGFVATVIGTLIVGIKAWSIAQGILNVVMAANPIGLVVLAIGALVLGIIYAYKHSETFRKIVQAAFTGVLTIAKTVGGWFKNTLWPWLKSVFDKINLAVTTVKDWIVRKFTETVSWLRALPGKIWGAISGAWTRWNQAVSTVKDWIVRKFGETVSWLAGLPGRVWGAISNTWTRFNQAVSTVKDWAVRQFNALVSFVTGLPKRIGSAAAGMFDGLKNAFRSAINWIIGKWNGLRFGIPAIDTHIPGIGKIGGSSFGVPQIPYLAKGGITTGPTLAMIGDNPGGREAVVPLPSGGLGGDTYNINVTGAIDPVGTGRAIVQAIKAYKLNSGGRQLGIG